MLCCLFVFDIRILITFLIFSNSSLNYSHTMFILFYFILLAIELSRKESTVLVFSDADAKDANREAEVRAAANDKNIIVTFLLTGTCSRRRRRETQGILIMFISSILRLGTAVNHVEKKHSHAPI